MKKKNTITHFSFLPTIILVYLSIFNIDGTQRSLAQNVGISNSATPPDASAMLDVTATDKGLLIPRVALNAINVATPITSPATSLLIYNTATASTGTNAVSPGYYYWNATKWVRFAYTASGNSTNDWNLLGNSGTTAGTHFIGTTDNQQLVFKANNIRYYTLTPAGHFVNDIFLNTNSLDVNAVGIGFNDAFGIGRSGDGYAGCFYNAQTTANSHVMMLKSASTASTSAILDISTGAIATAGTSVMRVLANGNVGINTSTPTSLLDVTKTNIGTTQLDAYSTSLINTTAATAGSNQFSPALRWRGYGWSSGASRSYDFRVFLAPTTSFGTLKPVLTFQTQTNNGGYTTLMNLINDATYGGALAIGDFVNPEASIEIRKAYANFYVRAYNNNHSFGEANIAIQTMGGTPTAPTASQANDIIGSLDFRGGFGPSVSGTTVARIDCYTPVTFAGSTRGGDLRFYTINTTTGGVAPERMRIASDGNVAIGTTNPLTKLHVAGLHTGSGAGTGVNSNAPSEAIITAADGGSYKNDWPTGWGGGLATFDVVGASAFFTGYVTRSDSKLKKDIEAMNFAIAKNFMKLRPVTYNLKEQISETEGLQYGFIAQEVAEVFPSIVTKDSGKAEAVIGMNYQALIAPTIYVVQQQQQKIEDQQTHIKLQEKQIAELIKRIEIIENK